MPEVGVATSGSSGWVAAIACGSGRILCPCVYACEQFGIQMLQRGYRWMPEKLGSPVYAPCERILRSGG